MIVMPCYRPPTMMLEGCIWETEYAVDSRKFVVNEVMLIGTFKQISTKSAVAALVTEILKGTRSRMRVVQRSRLQRTIPSIRSGIITNLCKRNAQFLKSLESFAGCVRPISPILSRNFLQVLYACSFKRVSYLPIY